ncbi:MAG: hypothetical protein Q9N34_09530 [Aquificota bacterium]|nr:hypothetical protein [Aquificota bacterium]
MTFLKYLEQLKSTALNVRGMPTNFNAELDDEDIDLDFTGRVVMLEGFEEVTDKDFYEKVMSFESPAVVLFVDPNSPDTERFVELLKPYMDQYGARIKFLPHGRLQRTPPLRTSGCSTQRQLCTSVTRWSLTGTTSFLLLRWLNRL